MPAADATEDTLKAITDALKNDPASDVSALYKTAAAAYNEVEKDENFKNQMFYAIPLVSQKIKEKGYTQNQATAAARYVIKQTTGRDFASEAQFDSDSE